MWLTGRGAAVVAAAAGLYGTGEVLGYPVLRALAGVAAGVVVAAVLATAGRLPVAVTRQVYPDRVQRGRPALATLVVGNTGRRRQGAFTARDLVGSGHHDVDVRPLPPGDAATYRYELPTARRGRLIVGPLSVVRADPLGLARRTASTGDTAQLWVHPRRHPIQAAVGGRPRHHHEGVLPRLPLRGSMDLRSLREYVVGDELRHLHWKATARTGQLMVREYVDPAQPRCVVLLDTRATVLSADAFEEAVEVAGSLLYAAAADDHPTRLLTADGLDLDTVGGLVAARNLLDRLCEVQQVDRAELGLEVRALARQRGGCLVFVTGGRAAAEMALVAGLRRAFAQVVVFDLSGQPAADVPGVVTIRTADAADAVRAWNSAVRR